MGIRPWFGGRPHPKLAKDLERAALQLAQLGRPAAELQEAAASHLRVAARRSYNHDVDVRTWIARMRESHDRADREEARRLAAMTPTQRAELLQQLSKAELRVVLALPEPQRRAALERRSPVPESTRRAFARLRAEHARRGHH